jgi:hypothetical protein
VDKPNYVKVVKVGGDPREYLWLHKNDYQPGGRFTLFVEPESAGPAVAPAAVVAPRSAPAEALGMEPPVGGVSEPGAEKPPATGNVLAPYDSPQRGRTRRR